jgi:hypothetical protein
MLALAKITGWTKAEIESMEVGELVYWVGKATAFHEKTNAAVN